MSAHDSYRLDCNDLKAFFKHTAVLITHVDAACYRPSSVLCRFVTIVSPAKTAQLIEVPYGLWTSVGPRNHVLDGGPDPPMQRGNFEGEVAAHCKVLRFCAVNWAETAEPIEMPFGCGLRWAQDVLDRGCILAPLGKYD